MDGAMGTELARLDVSPELIETEHGTLTEAERVAFVHSHYTALKARVLLTNTFQVNPVILAKRSADALHHTLWQSAIAAARSASPRAEFVLGDVGPIPGCSSEVAKEILKECRGLDGVLLETWSSVADLRTFAKERKPGQPPLLASFTFQRRAKQGWVTFEDTQPGACARAAKRCGAAALGVNCGRELDLKGLRDIVRRYHDACDLPIFVRPNAGTPTKTARGWRYPRSPEQMADQLGPLLEEGLAMVGGCCGTTPEHIWRFSLVLDAWNENTEPRMK